MFNLFKKKKKDDHVSEESVTHRKTHKQKLGEEMSSPNLPQGTIECEACDDPLYPWEKRKTHDGKKFHLKCYRKALKIAKSQINKGIGNL